MPLTLGLGVASSAPSTHVEAKLLRALEISHRNTPRCCPKPGQPASYLLQTSPIGSTRNLPPLGLGGHTFGTAPQPVASIRATPTQQPSRFAWTATATRAASTTARAAGRAPSL